MSYVSIFQRIRNIPVYGIVEEMNRDATDGITVIIDHQDSKSRRGRLAVKQVENY